MVSPIGTDREAASRAGEHGPARAASVRGVVLCGGRSTRMGADKALLVFEGESLLARAARVLAPITPDLQLACGPQERYAEFGWRLLVDSALDLGPLGGLEAALADGTVEWVLVLACDMPSIDTEILARLLEEARARDLDVCLVRSERGLEPLCGAWRATMLVPVRRTLARGERRVVAPLEEPRADGTLPRVGFVDVVDVECVLNLNAPGDLARAARGGDR